MSDVSLRIPWAVEDLTALLTRMRYPAARKKAEALINQLREPCLLASEVITRATSRLMVALVAPLEPLHEHIEASDKESERLFLSHADSELFQALPGAGMRLAPRLLADMGDDRCRDPDASRVQALAGPSPVLFQSGASQKAQRRLGCITPWRNALHQFAWQSTLQEAWAKESSQRKRAEGKSHTVAGRALSTVWARMLSAVWKKKERSQTTTFEHARLAHAPRVA